MPKPRKILVSLEATPYYHCVSRCVRRAFLCGTDSHSGRNYAYRRQWVEERLHELAGIFAIDLCGYAVMSNHYHAVLHVDRGTAESWDDTEVIRRWRQLFAGDPLSARFIKGETLSKAESDLLRKLVAEWRSRLMNISWFMRCINEPIARRANDEDGCTGRFWEGRFKSQAVLDEKALAACLTYVDLNPVRAGLADTPEASDHTSIQVRIRQALSGQDELQPAELMPFVGNPRQDIPKGLPFRLADYLELVDWTGRAIRDDKRGAIRSELPPILERLQIEPKYWLYMARHFESRFRGLVGAVHRLRTVCKGLGYRRVPNLAACRELLT